MKPSTPSPPGRRSAAVSLLVVLPLLAAFLAVSPASGFQAADASVAHDGEELLLRTAPEQVVAGQANLIEGDRVVVRIEAGGQRPFVLSRPATVGPDGAFDVRFDLSARRPAANVSVAVLHDSQVLTEVPAGIRAVRTTTPATTAEPTTAGPSRAPVTTATPPSPTDESLTPTAPEGPGAHGVPVWFAGLLAFAAATLAAVVVRGR